MDNIVETGSVGDGNLSRGVGPLFLETSLDYCPKGHRQYVLYIVHTRDFCNGRTQLREVLIILALQLTRANEHETVGFLKAISKSKDMTFIQMIPC